MANKTTVEQLTNESLLDEFEYAVKKSHYDPCGDMYEPAFTYDELRREVRKRMLEPFTEQ